MGTLHLLPSLADLAADPARAVALPVDAVEKFLAQVHVLEGILLARLLAARTVASGNGQGEPPAARGDRLLTVKQAKEKLGRSVDYLYHHADDLPFTVRQGRQVMFSEQGIDHYIRQQVGDGKK